MKRLDAPLERFGPLTRAAEESQAAQPPAPAQSHSQARHGAQPDQAKLDSPRAQRRLAVLAGGMHGHELAE